MCSMMMMTIYEFEWVHVDGGNVMCCFYDDCERCDDGAWDQMWLRRCGDGGGCGDYRDHDDGRDSH